MDSARSHWDGVYTQKVADQVSWYQDQAQPSLEWMQSLGLPHDAALIDVGGGASVLVDEWLALGYRRPTILDISARALEVAAQRLGERANGVNWQVGDITTAVLPASGFDLWHDRAVFHFLTASDARLAYRRQLQQALRPGGWLLMATFSERGPLHCSDLPVVRYDSESLSRELGTSFQLIRHSTQDHQTPRGTLQSFLYALFRFQS